MNGCGSVPIKLYCRKQITAQIRPSGHSLPAHDGEQCPYFYIYLFSLFLGRGDAPEAYGGSQASGLIGAAAAGAYTTAIAMPDPGRVCDLHHNSQQRWILNPLSEARDRTRVLMVPRRIRFRCTTTGSPTVSLL